MSERFKEFSSVAEMQQEIADLRRQLAESAVTVQMAMVELRKSAYSGTDIIDGIVCLNALAKQAKMNLGSCYGVRCRDE